MIFDSVDVLKMKGIKEEKERKKKWYLSTLMSWVLIAGYIRVVLFFERRKWKR